MIFIINSTGEIYSLFSKQIPTCIRIIQIRSRNVIRHTRKSSIRPIFRNRNKNTNPRQRCKKTLGIEIVRGAVESARENAKLNGLENIEFI